MFLINYLHFSIVVLNVSFGLTSTPQTGCILESYGKFKKILMARQHLHPYYLGLGVSYHQGVLKLLR